MATDSTAAGYLRPEAPSPDYDADLEDRFQALCVGIVDLPGPMVRPRWQINPAGLPDQDVNWASYGLTLSKRDWNPTRYHDPDYANGQGAEVLKRTEIWLCNYSFYGPNGSLLASMMQDGMDIEQNRAVISAAGIQFKEWADPVALPALLKDTWTRRVDLKGTFHRRITRIYPVRSFVSSSPGSLDNERYVTNLNGN